MTERTIKIEPGLWALTLISPNPTHCPHPWEPGEHGNYSPIDGRFRCEFCQIADPPPDHTGCDRCHTETTDLIPAPIRVSGPDLLAPCLLDTAFCRPCLTEMAHTAGEQAPGPMEPS